VRYPRQPGQRPSAADNPLGAWSWQTDIRGASSGLLAGKTVAIKDNVCVAGVPMMNVTTVLEGYVPEADATIVTRILDAGGTMRGKAICESLCFSGALGPARAHVLRLPGTIAVATVGFYTLAALPGLRYEESTARSNTHQPLMALAPPYSMRLPYRCTRT
jgi:amidase